MTAGTTDQGSSAPPGEGLGPQQITGRQLREQFADDAWAGSCPS